MVYRKTVCRTCNLTRKDHNRRNRAQIVKPGSPEAAFHEFWPVQAERPSAKKGGESSCPKTFRSRRKCHACMTWTTGRDPVGSPACKAHGPAVGIKDGES